MEVRLHKIFGPTIVTLIEKKGISVTLSRKFPELERLEKFVMRAGMIIHGTMDREERVKHHEQNITERIDKIKEELEVLFYCYLPPRCVYFEVGAPDSLKKLTKIKKALIGYEELGEVEEALDKFKKRLLRQIKVRKRPDVMDGLIRLFEEFLPKEKETFIDKQIITMLKPFGYDFEPGAVKMRKYRKKRQAKRIKLSLSPD